ncbi:hypothetical protein DSO57_1018446 [Entomophthora muscae]|uniref:Uncharacterized protein n=1 Tax=Entomophthora muscae TaxID=34485 RepID=A0ACC2RIT5_9FUNG|nr:hypothetical protein DSO57_1018446 [Entomophthora muscae]
MTPPVTPRLDRPLEPNAAAKFTSTQLFGVLCITLTGLVDSMVPNSGPWSLLGQSISYIIKLAPILWWVLPASLAAPHPELPNASTYDWIPDIMVKSLTCDDLDLDAVGYASPSSEGERIPMPPLPSQEESDPVPLETLEMLPHTPSHTPWLITGLVLMGLNSYFLQLSPVSSL